MPQETTSPVLGTDQEDALRQAATGAVQRIRVDLAAAL
jgi:hypothetical protein